MAQPRLTQLIFVAVNKYYGGPNQDYFIGLMKIYLMRKYYY